MPDDSDTPMQAPPDNAELVAQVAWLTSSLNIIAQANEALRTEVDSLRQEIEEMRTKGSHDPEPKVADAP